MAAPIEGVLLDAGNTLVFVDPRRVIPILAQAGAASAAKLYPQAEREARLALALAMGKDVTGHEDQFWRDYFGTVIRRSGVPEERFEHASQTLRRLHLDDHLWTWIQEGAPEALG